MHQFQNLGVIKNKANYHSEILDHFLEVINDFRNRSAWDKVSIVDLFNEIIPDFNHKETSKYLDGKM